MDKDFNSYLISMESFFKNLSNLYKKEKENYEKKLYYFTKPLILKYRVAKEVKKQVDKYLASDFNLINIMNPDENKISDIIALFLKPNGEHGQGKVFLEKFLKILKENLAENFQNKINKLKNLSNCEIYIEREVEAKGRLDIEIIFKTEEGNFFIIGIENKPWAGDQPKQIKRYSEELEKKTKDNYILLFISGNGRPPSEDSISEIERINLEKDGKLLCSSYHKFLLPWLKECFKECESEKVRWFLRDFITWIEKNFQEEVSNG